MLEIYLFLTVALVHVLEVSQFHLVVDNIKIDASIAGFVKSRKRRDLEDKK